MTEPLAFVFYEKLIPGQQLVNRLQDLGYRVQAVTDAGILEEQVQKHMPMLLVTEFPAEKTPVHQAIVSVKKNPATEHVAVLAYVAEANPALQKTARAAGINLVASESGVLEQLPQLLEQVLQVE
jgi:CheY-like chemotaxis protein